ncbi:MAG: sulfite exporter TauE/SafE family protein [Myxococcales bacterium]|nr:sulfite exporter TauE/SafE family protein [Myxococcales bacterium]
MMWPWFLWLVVFYGVWISLHFAFEMWHHTVEHWPIAAAMGLGSYVAGSTPMGGGTVGFPVLVLLFDLPASMGRNFGLAIQSVGMTSASIFILCRRNPVESRTLRYAIVGSAAGLVVGTFCVAPYISDGTVKLIFAGSAISVARCSIIGSPHPLWLSWARPSEPIS